MPLIFNDNLFRHDFTPSLFERMIVNYGKRVLWSKSTWCPNVIPGDEDRHKAGCTVCDGSQFIYYDEKETRAICQSMPLQQVFRAEGRFDLGTMMVTTPAAVDMNIWDKFKLVQSIVRYRENLTRNKTTDTDRPRYDIVRVNLLRSAKKVFVKGTDFICADGQIKWIGDAPALGELYAFDYDCHPVYIVVEMSNEFRDTLTKCHPTSTEEHFSQLPKRALCKRDFILRDESKDVRK